MTNKVKSHLNTIESRLTHGGIDRRQFMKSAVAAGLTVAAAITLADKAEAATPKRGGHFKFGISEGDTADTLNPATTGNQASINLAHTIRNFLTEIGPDNGVVGELAESWEPNSDATEWRFELRKGVEFHNGKSMDSDDVVASINHHRGKDSVSAAKSLLSSVDEIKADGKNAVTFKLSSGNADFPSSLTDYHLNILPKKGENSIDWESGTGTGAFKVKRFEAGVAVEMTRNPNYFKEGKGNFDSAEMLVLADTNARQTALVTGEIHAMDRADLKTLEFLKKNESAIVIENVTSWAHLSIPMHMDVDPYTSNDVRLALKYGINRKELLDKIMYGYGSLGNDHPISPVIPYAAEIEQRLYDPDKAKFHLKKAGYDNLKINLSTSDAAGPGAVDAASLYREHLSGTGIDLKVVREANDGYWSSVWLKKPFCMVFWGGRPTCDVMFTTAYAKGAPWNDSHMSHDRFNKLLLEARGELDSAKRAQMYAEMQMIVRDEGSTVIPFFQNHVYLRDSRLSHIGSLSANWSLDGNRAAERWWFS